MTELTVGADETPTRYGSRFNLAVYLGQIIHSPFLADLNLAAPSNQPENPALASLRESFNDYLSGEDSQRKSDILFMAAKDFLYPGMNGSTLDYSLANHESDYQQALEQLVSNFWLDGRFDTKAFSLWAARGFFENQADAKDTSEQKIVKDNKLKAATRMVYLANRLVLPDSLAHSVSDNVDSAIFQITKFWQQHNLSKLEPAAREKVDNAVGKITSASRQTFGQDNPAFKPDGTPPWHLYAGLNAAESVNNFVGKFIANYNYQRRESKQPGLPLAQTYNFLKNQLRKA